MTSPAPTILLVDDSPTILNLLSLGLRQQGFQVITAGDGLEALKAMAGRPVAAMVTDINMPRLDGMRLIEAVRRDGRLGGIPIVVLSTESETHDRQAALGRGANLYLVKPVSPAELAERLRALLG